MKSDQAPTVRKLRPVDETCDIMGGIGRTKLYDLIKRGELQLVKIGSRSFVTDDSIVSYIEAQKVGG